MVKTRIAALWTALALAGGLDSANAGTPDDPHIVTVRRGDSVSRLAARHGVSIADLRAWNKGVIGKDLVIRIGDRVRVAPLATKVPTTDAAEKPNLAPAEVAPAKAPKGPVWREFVTVRRGDTIGRIAKREGVTPDDLIAWNKLSKKAAIRAGDLVAIERSGKKPLATSVGRAVGGSLKDAVWLDRGTGYRLRFPKNAYGTEETVATLRTCAKRIHERFKGTADILYGDLSKPRGGRFPPHESHQSGRDADVGYYLDGNVQNATMHVVGAHEIDYTKTWALLRCFLRTGTVVRVYMDRRIQEGMAKHLATTAQASPALLAGLFQVVGGSNALIQHAPHHDTHLHVRFACPARDSECAQEPNEKAWTHHK